MYCLVLSEACQRHSEARILYVRELSKVPSTVIAAMNYNAEQRVLTIVYRGNRGTYRYYDVAPEEFDRFRTAPSKGAYLNHTFKERQHPYERVPSSQGIHRVK